MFLMNWSRFEFVVWEITKFHVFFKLTVNFDADRYEMVLQTEEKYEEEDKTYVEDKYEDEDKHPFQRGEYFVIKLERVESTHHYSLSINSTARMMDYNHLSIPRNIDEEPGNKIVEVVSDVQIRKLVIYKPK